MADPQALLTSGQSIADVAISIQGEARVGAIVGLSLPSFVGCREGAKEGRDVGLAEGVVLGALDGSGVGIVVGRRLGRRLGALEG